MRRGKGMKFVGDSRVPASNRKPNLPKDYSEFPGKTELFYPDFLLKEWLVGAVFLVGFLCLTVAADPPLEKLADPTDTQYTPVPDWYFMFLYQLLKYSYASGPFNIVGTIIIPGIAFTALLLAPFLDRGPERRPWKRPFATGFMLLAVAAIFYLTWEAVSQHDWEAHARMGKIPDDDVVEINKDHPAYAFYEQSCLFCHGGNMEGGAGPKLYGTELTVEEIMEIVKNGRGDMPPGTFQGTEEELQQLAEYITMVDELSEGETQEESNKE